MSDKPKIVPFCPNTKRHPHVNPRPLGQDADGTWRCGHCGYTEGHKPEYVVANLLFKKKLEEKNS
jgi:hypothetical protein